MNQCQPTNQPTNQPDCVDVVDDDDDDDDDDRTIIFQYRDWI